MNDVFDPLILVGGPSTIQDLVKQYAALKGWQRVQVIHFAPLEAESLAGWSRRTGQAILEMSRPGDKILIFLPESLYQGWWNTLEAAGRLTETPLYNLSLALQITILHRWITALESNAGSQAGIQTKPSSRFVRFLKKIRIPALFLKKRLRRSSSATQQE